MISLALRGEMLRRATMPSTGGLFGAMMYEMISPATATSRTITKIRRGRGWVIGLPAAMADMALTLHSVPSVAQSVLEDTHAQTSEHRIGRRCRPRLRLLPAVHVQRVRRHESGLGGLAGDVSRLGYRADNRLVFKVKSCRSE